jgi:hypothetical protein
VEDEDKIATEALVFMLVGLKSHLKYPIGHVMCYKIGGEMLKCFITNALNLCAAHNIDAHTVTMDGAKSNVSAMKRFGCKFGSKEELIDGSFNFPGFDHPLLFILDPPHMLKLGRNAFSDLGVFIDGDENEIRWQHIKDLVELQEQEGLKLGNKLSRRNIAYH